MKNLLDFKNHVVFDSVYIAPSVNTFNASILEFEVSDDIQLCNHCFYGGSNKRVLLGETKNKKKPRTPSKPRTNKKNKTIRR